jgi:hypothetical protein
VEFSELFLQVEYERRQVAGLDELDQAMDDGGGTVDLTYRTPPTAPATMSRLRDVMEQVYAQLSGRVLLSVPPPPDLRALEDWYLGQFARQAVGEEPARWTGPLRLRLSARREVS